MPFDPISAAVAGAGMIFDFIKGQGAKKQAANNVLMQQAGLADQQGLLAQALQAARMNQGQMVNAASQGQTDRLIAALQSQSDRMRTAGGLREDQFGNATYYDPAQGRWITQYSPTQQRLIDEGQARQGRAQARGAQASEDYNRLRGEYLYRQPKTEAESYAEIINLINQAMGTGEQQLNTLANRFNVRTEGNIPQIRMTDTGPSPGQQLAETMLKARGAALDESLKRQQGRQSQYLPALKQFEETANYVAPIDPTGSGIVGMAEKGRGDVLGVQGDYQKLIDTIYGQGTSNMIAALTRGGVNEQNAFGTGARGISSAYSGIGNAYNQGVTAAGKGPGASEFLNLAKMFLPDKAGKAGPTDIGTAERVTSGGGSSSDSGPDVIGTHDKRFNFGPAFDKKAGGGVYDTGVSTPPGDTQFTVGPPLTYDFGNRYGAYDYSGAPWGDYATPWRF